MDQSMKSDKTKMQTVVNCKTKPKVLKLKNENINFYDQTSANQK